MMKIAPTFTARTVLFNFGPWIVYGLVSATGHGRVAFVGGLIASLCQIAPQWRMRHLKIMDGVSLLFFLAGTVSTLVLHSSLFPGSGSVLIWSTFAVVAWGSLLVGAPFTAEYARDAVPRTLWDNPAFRRVNVAITAVWGAVFIINAALAAMMTLKLSWSLGHAERWLQVVPYVGTIFGIVFTNRFPQWVSRQKPKDNEASPVSPSPTAGSIPAGDPTLAGDLAPDVTGEEVDPGIADAGGVNAANTDGSTRTGA